MSHLRWVQKHVLGGLLEDTRGFAWIPLIVLTVIGGVVAGYAESYFTRKANHKTGQYLEQIVPGVAVTETECNSCGELTGQPTQCRAVTVDGRTHEAVPAELIRSALCRVANCCGEDCNCGCGCGESGAKSRTGKVRAANGPQCCGLNPAGSRRPLKRQR